MAPATPDQYEESNAPRQKMEQNGADQGNEEEQGKKAAWIKEWKRQKSLLK